MHARVEVRQIPSLLVSRAEPDAQTARRHWVMDQNWVYEVGETVDFFGVKAT